MKKKIQKIAVAISGGVDSSVAAWLLKNQGYDIFGIFMDFGFGQKEEKFAAFSVAKHLGIKMVTVDLKNKFEKEIIGYFTKSYQQGITPNPCIKCNKFIKFGELLKNAMTLGADYLATGHYARIQETRNLLSRQVGKKQETKFKLMKASDKNKDQSYFLYTLDQRKLARIKFPLGNFMKEKVKRIAEKEGLPVLEKESQDVCFLTKNGNIIAHNEFLKKRLKLKSGPIISSTGINLGTHQGLPLYTIGQRRGIEIGGIGPFYVSRLDYKKNILHVVDKYDDKSLYGKKLIMLDSNWTLGYEPDMPLDCYGVLRYRHSQVKCKLIPLQNKKYQVEFKVPQRAITPGQSIVLYRGNQMLGGGIIK
jgi:tRNA-uridine 2-sulfurtransferase